MRGPWSVHVKIDVLNRITDVRPSEGEVLQSTCQAAEISGISSWKQVTIRSRQLGVDVDCGGTGLAGSHVGPVQNVDHILPLGKEKPILLALNMHPQEVKKLSKFLLRELLQGPN
jgi:hypothetical protein